MTTRTRWYLRLAFICALTAFFLPTAPALALLTFICLPAVFRGVTLTHLLGANATDPVAARFQETPCSVVVNNNFDTHGTITRASVAHLTPAQLEQLFKPGGLFADMDSWFRTQFEMKACGTKTNGIYDWLMSSQRDLSHLLSVEKMDRGASLLKPFIMGRQDSVINKDFWAVVGGIAKSGYTGNNPNQAQGSMSQGPLTTADLALGASTDRIIRVVTRYGIDMNPQWFASRDRVHIWNTGNGTVLHGQWKVLASEVDVTFGYVDVLVTDENGGSTTPFDAAPTAGVLFAGTNNVTDYETFCQNRPTLDPRKRVPYWYKTDRWGRSVDSVYKEVFARLMETNAAFQQFGDLPLAERNRQDEEERQRRWVNDFFFSKAISANQTMANWQNLEQVNYAVGTIIDPGLGGNGKLAAYRANPVGVLEQLQACGRVFDLQGNALNWYEFLNQNYLIMRARRSQGRPCDTLDWFTSTPFAAQIETAFFAYLKAEYGDILRINIEEGSNEELGFRWRIYKPKYPAGLKIAIVTHEFFDDMENAFNTEGILAAGRVLWCLDMGKPGPKGGTIYPGRLADNTKMRTLGDIENLARIDPGFACTMEYVTEEIRLISQTWTAICECPANSAAVKNIANAVPVTTGVVYQTGDVGYSNLY